MQYEFRGRTLSEAITNALQQTRPNRELHLKNKTNQNHTTTHYIWRTQRDGRVRSRHAIRDGQIYAWDNPPPGGHPGEDYGCRCRAEPIQENDPKIPNGDLVSAACTALIREIGILKSDSHLYFGTLEYSLRRLEREIDAYRVFLEGRDHIQDTMDVAAMVTLGAAVGGVVALTIGIATAAGGPASGFATAVASGALLNRMANLASEMRNLESAVRGFEYIWQRREHNNRISMSHAAVAHFTKDVEIFQSRIAGLIEAYEKSGCNLSELQSAL